MCSKAHLSLLVTPTVHQQLPPCPLRVGSCILICRLPLEMMRGGQCRAGAAPGWQEEQAGPKGLSGTGGDLGGQGLSPARGHLGHRVRVDAAGCGGVVLDSSGLGTGKNG